MQQRFRLILALSQAGTLAVLMVAQVFAQSPTTNAQVTALINQIQYKSLPSWRWDAKGNLISLGLSWEYATDTNLALLSGVGSIRTLYIQGTRRQSFTREGISSLNRLTNLTELHSVVFGRKGAVMK